MASEIHTRPDWALSLQDQRWELLQRVAASVVFHKSNRLRELLLFVGEQALRNPERPIREHDIGVEVFGRPANYDTSQDTLVRVQASQLRKKLQQYFTEEGRDEPMVIDLPKGSYAPLFRMRDALGADGAEVVELPGEPRRRSWMVYACGLLGLICCGLFWQNLQLRRTADFGFGPKPHVDALWRSMFGNGEHTALVLADGNLVILQDHLHRMLTLSEYQNRNFDRLVQDAIPDPSVRTIVLNAAGRQFTSIGDAVLARRIGLVCASNRINLDVVLARDITINQINQHNTILTGSLRANPWVGLFEDQLNFRTVFEESPKNVYFENRTPRKGEPGQYRGVWSRLSYCRVAYLPNVKGNGHVLLVSGTDIQATEAGGDLVTVESWVEQLRQALGVREGEDLPHFEALLEGRLLNNTVPRFELVATRRH